MPKSKHRRNGITRPRGRQPGSWSKPARSVVWQGPPTPKAVSICSAVQPSSAHGDDDDDIYGWMQRGTRWQKARKPYACQGGDPADGRCGATIQPGERYCRVTLLNDAVIGPRGRPGMYEHVILCGRCGGEGCEIDA